MEKGRFSGRLWLDWGNTTRAAMAGLGSKGMYIQILLYWPDSVDECRPDAY